MNKRNGIFIYIIMVLCVFALSGCSSSNGYEGEDVVDKAKQHHTDLEAASISVQDRNTGIIIQEIDYRFVGDVMQYMYIGRDADTGEEYYEFNNGTELDAWHTGDSEWSFAAKGTENYYGYSRAKRHYFADGALLLNDYASAVKSASTKYERGDTKVVKVVKIEYDDAVISQNEQMKGVTNYRQEYWIDVTQGRSECDSCYVDYTKDGKTYSYWIRMESRDPEEQIQRAEPPELTEAVENTQ